MHDALDRQLAAALNDVPIPDGLGQRLLSRLAESEAATSIDTLRHASPPGAACRRRTRRWVVAAASLAAMAASLLLAVWLGFHGSEPLSEELVLGEAIQTFTSMDDQATTLSSPDPDAYPFSAAVVAVRGIRWQSIQNVFHGRQGIVYRLPNVGGAGAALFVVDAESSDEFAESPGVHPFTTAGCCASVWLEGGRVYVLVVQGDPSAYRACLNLPRGPLA